MLVLVLVTVRVRVRVSVIAGRMVVTASSTSSVNLCPVVDAQALVAGGLARAVECLVWGMQEGQRASGQGTCLGYGAHIGGKGSSTSRKRARGHTWLICRGTSCVHDA